VGTVPLADRTMELVKIGAGNKQRGMGLAAVLVQGKSVNKFNARTKGKVLSFRDLLQS